MKWWMTALAGVGCVVLATAASAHDFWIEPSSFRAQVGTEIGLKLRVGHKDDINDVPRTPERIERFEVLSTGGTAKATADTGASPAGNFTPKKTGWHVAVYDSNHAYSELPGERFNDYLVKEGLDAALALRKKRGHLDMMGREIYSRCSKAIIAVGTPSAKDETWKKPVGMPLELVPVTLPTQQEPKITVQLLYEGKPLAKAKVEATSPSGQQTSVRTDDAGRATLTLTTEKPEKGFWMLGAVHMKALPEGANVQWESFWANLTLSLAATAR